MSHRCTLSGTHAIIEAASEERFFCTTCTHLDHLMQFFCRYHPTTHRSIHVPHIQLANMYLEQGLLEEVGRGLSV